MPLDQALVGSIITQVGALAALALSKCKCHVACKRDEDNEFCEPSVRCAFMDGTLASLDSYAGEQSSRETPAKSPET